MSVELSITQPYFFPYLGIFQLIHATNQLIVFDTVKYQKRSWMNRNRILHPKKAFNYICMPVKKKPNNTPICDIEIVDGDSWKEKILGQLTIYAKRAPYYQDVCMLMKKCFSLNETMYAPICMGYMDIICEHLELEFKYEYFSEMDIELQTVNEPGEWSFYISQALKANKYINLPAGVSIFDEKLFSDEGIELLFIHPQLRSYQQLDSEFKSHLSILDVLMWNSKEAVKDMITKDYRLLKKTEFEE